MLLPKLRIHFADFPWSHCSIDQRLFTSESGCGFRYGRVRAGIIVDHERSIFAISGGAFLTRATIPLNGVVVVAPLSRRPTMHYLSQPRSLRNRPVLDSCESCTRPSRRNQVQRDNARSCVLEIPSRAFLHLKCCSEARRSSVNEKRELSTAVDSRPSTHLRLTSLASRLLDPKTHLLRSLLLPTTRVRIFRRIPFPPFDRSARARLNHSRADLPELRGPRHRRPDNPSDRGQSKGEPPGLGPTSPCPSTVLMESYSASVFWFRDQNLSPLLPPRSAMGSRIACRSMALADRASARVPRRPTRRPSDCSDRRRTFGRLLK